MGRLVVCDAVFEFPCSSVVKFMWGVGEWRVAWAVENSDEFGVYHRVVAVAVVAVAVLTGCMAAGR